MSTMLFCVFVVSLVVVGVCAFSLYRAATPATDLLDEYKAALDRRQDALNNLDAALKEKQKALDLQQGALMRLADALDLRQAAISELERR
jgi:Skp family chaperone for outer membrane proteins